ncbi:MAG TPA: DEAD/DEAH box helicase [Gracilimonas sp.]|uniref:DEAD/DEAH box helicase n=1 Tax=Gracilimonas sp. TaxID=1974203 RepID=UPI002D8867F1|nr:DEAD/DEAH box helicase [Gracilimonas sp.]
MSFKSLYLSTSILKSLEEEGYTHPTPIQSQAIPIALKGTDVLGCAQTGTGKTAAFAIPILQLLSADKSGQQRKIRSLIVTPTRELAIQIDESFQSYGRYTDLNTAVVFGGVNQKSQVKKLKRGVDILTATPGRLLDLMNQGFISLSDVEIFVLDEADRMLDMGFIHDIKKLLKALPNKRQTLFFSATMPSEIVKLSRSILNNPVKVEVTPESSTVDVIEQGIYFVDKGNKKNLLVDVLQEAGSKSALVFTRTKHGANKVVKLLNSQNIQAEAIHGNKSQTARQRALGNFKDQVTRVLVATDIAARGIDVDELQYVINYEIPNVPETYVHRIGRTGRAGLDGTALSFCDAQEKAYLRDIEKLIGQEIPVIDEHKYPLIDHNPTPPEKQKHRPSRKHKSEKRKTSNGGKPKSNNKNRRRKGSGNRG